jgi:competence protein ComEC
MRLYLFAALVALGIIAGSAFSLPLEYALLALLIAAALFCYARIARTGDAYFFLILLALAGFSTGLARIDLAQNSHADGLAPFSDSKVGITGVITEDPDEREAYTQLVIDVEKADANGKEVSPHEKILARVPIQSDFRYGDYVSVSGKLEKPQNFDTGTGRVFDYQGYLAKDGIYYEIGFAQSRLIEHGHGNPLEAGLIALKRAVEHAISSVIPDPQGALENGILLGAKQSLGQSTLDDFKLAGLSHVVVLSGYNIAIVSQTALRIFSFLPNVFAFGASGLSIILFAMMAGAGASIVRAAVMSLIALLARVTHREYDAFRALIIAAFFMVLQNPFIVTDDPSFQLSFLATFGIIAVTPIVESRFRFLSEKFNIKETVVSTVSTQIFVLPFLVYMSGIISPAAFPANLLVLPLVPVTMLLGFITALLAFVSKWLAIIPGFAAYGLLAYILAVTHFFARIPFGSFLIQQFPAWGIWLWYGVYGIILWRWHSTPRSKAVEVPKFDMSLAFEIIE